MGSASFHVVGRGEESALCSSSHGAGREFSRVWRRRRSMCGVWREKCTACGSTIVMLRLLRTKRTSALQGHRCGNERIQRDLTRIERQLRRS